MACRDVTGYGLSCVTHTIFSVRFRAIISGAVQRAAVLDDMVPPAGDSRI
jgi:hypothetical protein